MERHSRVYAEIDLDAIRYNKEQLKKRIGKEGQITAVIKADGYGHGAIPVAKIFESDPDVWGYATAAVEEALELRTAGIKKSILVLGCIFPDQYEEAIEQELCATIFSKEMAWDMAKVAQNLKKTVKYHIKIDTGMGRLGFPATQETVEQIVELSKLPNVEIEGMYTHFAKADEADKTYTNMQYERFLWMKQQMEKQGVNIPRYHCDNSAGIIEFPNWKHDLVRAGIALYGLYPSDEINRNAITLRPALDLISHVSFVKDVEPGTFISYGGTFEAKKRMRIATIPVGYGDGYARSLSNKGEVLIHGKRAKILGRICMDQFMVDVTEIPEVQFMDRVVLIGKDGEEEITVEELSNLSGRFPYEFICCLGKRIPRIYKDCAYIR